MFDFTDLELRDLFKIRDAQAVLVAYGLEDKDIINSINQELESRKMAQMAF